MSGKMPVIVPREIGAGANFKWSPDVEKSLVQWLRQQPFGCVFGACKGTAGQLYFVRYYVQGVYLSMWPHLSNTGSVCEGMRICTLVVLQGESRKLFFWKEKDEDGTAIPYLALRVRGLACGAGGVEENTAPLSMEVVERVIDKALPLYEKYGRCTEYEELVLQTEGNRIPSLHKRYMRTVKGCENRNSFTALRFMLTEGMFAADVGCICSL